MCLCMCLFCDMCPWLSLVAVLPHLTSPLHQCLISPWQRLIHVSEYMESTLWTLQMNYQVQKHDFKVQTLTESQTVCDGDEKCAELRRSAVLRTVIELFECVHLRLQTALRFLWPPPAPVVRALSLEGQLPFALAWSCLFKLTQWRKAWHWPDPAALMRFMFCIHHCHRAQEDCQCHGRTGNKRV